MIYLYLNNSPLYSKLIEHLNKNSIPYKSLPNDSASIHLKLVEEIYSASAFIIDEDSIKNRENLWQDLIYSLSRRTQVYILSEKAIDLPPFQNQVYYIDKDNLDKTLGKIYLKIELLKLKNTAVPILNKADFCNELAEKGFLNTLLIDASSIIKLRNLYGIHVYNQVQEILEEILQSLWQQKGGFRKKDKIFKKAPNSNYYYVLLEDQRKIKRLSAPGNLETVADRLSVSIQNKLFEELFYNPDRKSLNIAMADVPFIRLGYHASIYNPCTDPQTQIVNMLESTHHSANFHFQRREERLKDFLNIIFRNPDLITPAYQAIFSIAKLDVDSLDRVSPENRIDKLRRNLKGFESLARLDTQLAKKILGTSANKLINFRFFNPELLFCLAKQLGLANELDQTCLKQAINCSHELDGPIFVNILPSNLYHVEQLSNLYSSRPDIVFEVSEAEAINNIELMQSVRNNLRKQNIKIAADDFGIGYAGLDRIIQIAPDIIKIDRSLIQNINHDENKQNYLGAILDAARKSGAKILAEGIETAAELRCLQEIGIEYGQGYYLHKPSQPSQIAEKLINNIHLIATKKIA